MAEIRIGECLKNSFKFLREDVSIFSLYLIPLIGFYSVILVFFAVSPIQNIKEILLFQRIPTPVKFQKLTLWFVSGLASFLLGILAQAGVITKVKSIAEGWKSSTLKSLKEGLEHFPRLLITNIVFLSLNLFVWMNIQMAFFTFPSSQFMGKSIGHIVREVAKGTLVWPISSSITLLIYLVLSTAACLYVIIKIVLFAPACVLEGNLGIKSSWRRTPGNFWRLLSLLIIFGIIWGVIGSIPFLGSTLEILIVEPLLVTVLTLSYYQTTERY